MTLELFCALCSPSELGLIACVTFDKFWSPKKPEGGFGLINRYEFIDVGTQLLEMQFLD